MEEGTSLDKLREQYKTVKTFGLGKSSPEKQTHKILHDTTFGWKQASRNQLATSIFQNMTN